MRDERKPAAVFSVAEMLCDEIVARGWTTEDVARRMNTGRPFANDLFIIDLIMTVQDDGLLIDDITFDGLSAALGVSNWYFRNIDAAWRKWPDCRQMFVPPDSIFSLLSKEASSPGPPNASPQASPKEE